MSRTIVALMLCCSKMSRSKKPRWNGQRFLIIAPWGRRLTPVYYTCTVAPRSERTDGMVIHLENPVILTPIKSCPNQKWCLSDCEIEDVPICRSSSYSWFLWVRSLVQTDETAVSRLQPITRHRLRFHRVEQTITGRYTADGWLPLYAPLSNYYWSNCPFH